ncbi:MAG: transposase [Tannerellaceae bacterium]|nr:transposase [Tannerellaceae bacterium]
MDNLFIGIDFSKKTFNVNMFSESKIDVVSYRQFENSFKGFKELISWIKSISSLDRGHWIFCAEHTGLYSLELSNYLIEKDYFLWLEDPREIKLSSGKKREKNDKVDSYAIALYGYRFRDKARRGAPPQKELESLGLLLSYRNHLLKNKHALLVSASELRRVLKIDQTARYIYERSYSQIALLEREIKEVEKKMKGIILTTKGIKENYDLVTSVKGISLINAVVLLVHTANFTTFKEARSLACYVGVVPFGKSSGTSLDRGRHVSKMCNKRLKAYLTQAAQAAVRYDKELKAYYEWKLREGKAKKLVLNNVRNKLIQRVFAVVRDKTPYREDYRSLLLKEAA